MKTLELILDMLTLAYVGIVYLVACAAIIFVVVVFLGALLVSAAIVSIDVMNRLIY